MVVMATRLIRHEIRPVVYIIDMKKKFWCLKQKKQTLLLFLRIKYNFLFLLDVNLLLFTLVKITNVQFENKSVRFKTRTESWFQSFNK